MSDKLLTQLVLEGVEVGVDGTLRLRAGVASHKRVASVSRNGTITVYNVGADGAREAIFAIPPGILRLATARIRNAGGVAIEVEI